MIYDTIINGVASRVVNRKSDGKTITIFEVTDSQGTVWTTARKDLAAEAQRLIGRGVQLQGETRQNGNFTNHYLEGVLPAGEHPAAYVSEQFPVPPSQQAAQTPAQPSIPEVNPLPTVAPVGPTERDWHIWRQTATKVAAQISASPAEFWDNVDKLVDFYAHNRKPAIPAAPEPNKFIPAGTDPGPDPTRPEYDDSDIPF